MRRLTMLGKVSNYFYHWAGVEMVTNSRASVDNKNGLAKPNEKVIIPA